MCGQTLPKKRARTGPCARRRNRLPRQSCGLRDCRHGLRLPVAVRLGTREPSGTRSIIMSNKATDMLSTVVLWCHAYSRFGMAPGRIDVVRMRILLSVMTRLFFWWLVPRACVCGRCRVSRLRHIKGAISVPRWWRRAAPRARRDTGPLHAGGAQGGGRREASTGQKDAASSGGRGGEPRARGGPCPRRAPAVRRGVGPMPGSPWQGAVCSQGTQ